MTPTTAERGIRDRLKAVREEAARLRAERNGAKKERDDAKEAFAKAEHDIANVTEWPEFTAAEDATRKLGTIDDQLNDLSRAENGLLQLLGDRLDGNDNDNGRHQSMEHGEHGAWSAHQLLAQDDGEYRRAVEAGLFTSRNQFGTVTFGQVADRDTAMQYLAATLPVAPAADVGTPANRAVPHDYRGVQGLQLRRLRLLDLFPTGTTDSNNIDYVQVTAVPGSAAETAELTLKPGEGMTLLDAVAPVRTIAGWIKVARQALDDMAGLRTLIDTLLPYDVRRRIENQILVGNGTGQNLTGIFNTTGVGAPAFVAGDNAADAILRAMTVVILSDADPNFVAAYPTVWQDLLLTREAGGSSGAGRTGTYLYGGPGSIGNAPGTPTVWGLLMTPSPVIPAATPLVGDANGATLLFREGVNVKASDSDQDDFIRNRVTLLAEARVAFPVWRPASFAKAALS